MKRLSRILMLGAAAAFASAFSVSVAAQPKAPTTVILKGSPQGGVKFDHVAHQKAAANKCETCHHASKTEKPMAAGTKEQKCQDCHTKTPTAPMKTGARAAFHDPMAKKGICVDCHVEQGKAGKKVPAKCADCHQKANV